MAENSEIPQDSSVDEIHKNRHDNVHNIADAVVSDSDLGKQKIGIIEINPQELTLLKQQNNGQEFHSESNVSPIQNNASDNKSITDKLDRIDRSRDGFSQVMDSQTGTLSVKYDNGKRTITMDTPLGKLSTTYFQKGGSNFKDGFGIWDNGQNGEKLIDVKRRRDRYSGDRYYDIQSAQNGKILGSFEVNTEVFRMPKENFNLLDADHNHLGELRMTQGHKIFVNSVRKIFGKKELPAYEFINPQGQKELELFITGRGFKQIRNQRQMSPVYDLRFNIMPNARKVDARLMTGMMFSLMHNRAIMMRHI